MKAEAGTAKHQSKQLKASGLQKLKFYCQLCLKQCRDANGFKNHLSSPSHQGRLSNLATGNQEDPIDKFSDQFSLDFLKLLKMNHGTKRINANRFYQEYILNDRDHIHMNATRWTSLTAFVKFLGLNGHVKVERDGGDDDELNFTIALIDRSPQAVQRQELLLKKQKISRSDDEVMMRLLKRQIERGKERLKLTTSLEEPEPTVSKPVVPSAGPVKVSMSLKQAVKKRKAPSAFDEDDEEESDNEENLGNDKVQKKTNEMKRISERLFKR